MTRLPPPLRPLFPLAKRSVLLGTEVVGPVMRRLPRRPGDFGAPRGSVSDTGTRHGAGTTVELPLMATTNIDHGPAVGVPPDHPGFTTTRHVRGRQPFVTTVPDGRAVAPWGAVVSRDDTLLGDLSPYFGVRRPTQHPIMATRRLPAVHDHPRPLGAVVTRGGDNYYHFLVDVLPRIAILDAADHRPDDLWISRPHRFQDELLDMVGVDARRVVDAAEHPHVRAPQLVVPSLPDDEMATPPWVARWLRRHLLPEAVEAPHRRLFVQRPDQRNTRRLVNGDEVFSVLEPLGFEPIDPGTLSVRAQIQRFSEAEIVVGTHGAGLTNIVFCPPGAVIVELFSPRYVNACYQWLAAALEDVRYRYLVGDGGPPRRAWRLGVADDVAVDPLRLRRLVDEFV